jgi:hypothetical protein
MSKYLHIFSYNNLWIVEPWYNSSSKSYATQLKLKFDSLDSAIEYTVKNNYIPIISSKTPHKHKFVNYLNNFVQHTAKTISQSHDK